MDLIEIDVVRLQALQRILAGANDVKTGMSMIVRAKLRRIVHAEARPETMEGLVRLPGVGRKTANVILGNAFHCQAGIAVDTHVKRLSQRLDLTDETNPDKIEQDLMALVPREDWTLISHLLILHGRNICKARAPQCEACPVSRLCPSARPKGV